MIYRALRDLGLGKSTIKTGELFSSARLGTAALEILEQQQKIAPASLPPVVAIGRLKAKSAALGKIGVMTTGDFLEKDISVLAQALKSDEATVRQIKAEMYAKFASPPPARD